MEQPTNTVYCSFLVDESHVIPAAEEIKLATLCIDYLNLPAFVNGATDDMVLNGDYGFMDYAILHWIRHLEAGVVQSDDNAQLMKQLAESLEIFIQQHWNSPSATFVVSERNRGRLEFFKDLTVYDKLEQAVVSTRKQLTFFGKMRKEEIALDLADIVGDVRKILERIVTSPMEASLQQNIKRKYGTNLFKCPRFSCKFFTTGFPSADEREKHVGKHDRPFRCPDETCTGFAFGFASEKEREKHMKETHSTLADREQEFPTDQDVEQSIKSKTTEDQPTAIPVEVQDSEPEPEPELMRRKKRPQKEFTCEHCGKVFTKRYNWQSHLRTHETYRPWKCDVCWAEIGRRSDFNRHMSKHTGEKKFICSGILKDGRRWGCGKSFSRADILSNHHKSKAGEVCVLPLRQEQEQERNESRAEEVSDWH